MFHAALLLPVSRIYILSKRQIKYCVILGVLAIAKCILEGYGFSTEFYMGLLTAPHIYYFQLVLKNRAPSTPYHSANP